jgi:predicted ATPase/DNA-binding winged helix-turn-helix (wHTH) protein
VTLLFGNCELDIDRHELRRDGEVVPLEPQVFKVLAHLVVNRESVVAKEQILDDVWGDRFVSESALTTRIKAARAAVGDDGKSQRLIKTVHGLGYRFVGDVTEAVAAPTISHNLRTDRTPLFGRGRDIEQVTELIRAHRLVTLLGIGGTGKTRLATAVGREVVDRFAHGVWFVDLVPVADSRSIVTAIADAAGLALAHGSGPDALAELLGDRDILLILDNCEHVNDEVATVVDTLLDATGGSRFLLTTREPIALEGERRVPLDPLALADEAELSPAAQLFLASADRFGIHLGDEQHDQVQQICAHLDGLPLAIELAAAQLRQLSLEELANRLDQRFELLESGNRRQPRQSSLNSVLTDTWEMLDDKEQLLLCQLAAFPRRFDVASVEQVATGLDIGVPALTLAGLADRSLISHDHDQAGHDLLETVRLFARQRNEHGSAEQFADRHSRWCLQQVGQDPGEHFYSWELVRWCSEHHDDLMAAERHMRISNRAADAAELLTATALTMHMDAGTRASACLARIDGYLDQIVPDEWPDLVARLHLTAVACGMATRSSTRIESHGTAALVASRRSDSAVIRALALVLASWSTVFEDPGRAIEMVEEAESIASRSGEEATADVARTYRGSHLVHVGRIDEALPVLWEIMDRRCDSVDYSTYTARNTLASALLLTDPETALDICVRFEGRPRADEQSWTHTVLRAAVEVAVGNLAEAVSILDATRAYLGRAANDDGLPDVLIPAAVAAHLSGEDDRARRWLTAIRGADRPTQSFQTTALFRQLRLRVGLDDDDPLTESSLLEIDGEARAWMVGRIEEVAGRPAR